nr:MAG TPA: hypothetical protein [Caudoviricetes sp.]
MDNFLPFFTYQKLVQMRLFFSDFFSEILKS